jgi:hypothetical protein
MNEHEHEPHWIKKLVRGIEEADHDAAVEARERNHRAEIVKTKGPIFWRSFGDFLSKFVTEMNEEFGDHPAGDAKISFQKGGQESYRISKAAFPFVNFSATPDFSGGPNMVNFAAVNPERPSNGNVLMSSIPCRFEVLNDEVELQLNGHLYEHPEEAASFVMEKLFTVCAA